MKSWFSPSLPRDKGVGGPDRKGDIAVLPFFRHIISSLVIVQEKKQFQMAGASGTASLLEVSKA
jgi:hypothetical protein